MSEEKGNLEITDGFPTFYLLQWRDPETDELIHTVGWLVHMDETEIAIARNIEGDHTTDIITIPANVITKSKPMPFYDWPPE